MDFLTHTFVGVGLTRLVVRRRDLLPQFALAAILASTLVDGDSWLALLGPDMYGRYHRLATHSIPGLILVGGVLSASIAYVVFTKRSWRRFGFFVTPNLAADSEVPSRVPWPALFGVALLAVSAHWVGDWITGYGNIVPLWPLSSRDVSLSAVHSFDWVIFSATAAWFLSVRKWEPPRRVELLIAAVWFVIVSSYVTWKALTGEPTVW